MMIKDQASCFLLFMPHEMKRSVKRKYVPMRVNTASTLYTVDVSFFLKLQPETATKQFHSISSVQVQLKKCQHKIFSTFFYKDIE